MPKKIRARFVALTEIMSKSGPNIGMPHTRAMGNGLFELRIKAEEGIARVFYCTYVNNEIIMLHAFIKKTQTTPKKELVTAKKTIERGNEKWLNDHSNYMSNYGKQFLMTKKHMLNMKHLSYNWIYPKK